MRPQNTQRIIGSALFTVDAAVMNRTLVASGAKLLFFFWRFRAHGAERSEDFIPVLIGLFHRIYLALMFTAVRVSRFATETLGCGAGGEKQLSAGHQSLPRSGKLPKKVSVLTCPLVRSRDVTIVMFPA